LVEPKTRHSQARLEQVLAVQLAAAGE